MKNILTTKWLKPLGRLTILLLAIWSVGQLLVAPARASTIGTNSLLRAASSVQDRIIGGVDLGNLPNYLFVFANGNVDANWQGATKGFNGNVAINGLQAAERTSGGVPFSGFIYTNDSTLGAWQAIVNQNAGQATAITGEIGTLSGLESDLNAAFAQIDLLASNPPSGFNGNPTSLDSLNTQNDSACITYVLNVRTGFQVSSKINITGDDCDVFVMRWDTDADPTNGYQGQVKFQSGGAIVPLGALKATNFIHVAGDISASGGGGNPVTPFPQGPRSDDGLSSLCTDCHNFSGGGFFTGYWLTTGDPSSGNTHSLSNAIFVGGWYTLTNKFSMTSGTSAVYVSPPGPIRPFIQ